MDTYTSFSSTINPHHSPTAYNPYQTYAAIAPPPHQAPRPVLKDDRKLFENYDRFLQCEIDQKEFQDESCKRLLFTWEWALHLCFCNYNQALETWYQLLRETGDEDIWLWVDGDEQQSQRQRLIHPLRGTGSPTDLEPSCALSPANLKKAVEILKARSQNRGAPAPPSSWRRQLDACGKPHLRFMAVAFTIATSTSLRALDRDRGIKDRTVWSLLENLDVSNHCQETMETRLHKFQTYVARLKAAGHTCTKLWPYFESHCALFELVGITNANRQIHSPIYHQRDHWPSNKGADIYIDCPECRESRPLLLSAISWRVQAASGSPEALATETLPTFTPKKYIHLLWWFWCTFQLKISGSTGVLGNVDEWLQWLRLLALQPTMDIRENGDDYQAAHGPTRVLRHLLSQQMLDWLESDDWNGRFKFPKVYLSSDNICILGSPKSLKEYMMYIPSSKEWKTAEVIFSELTTAWHGNNDFVDIRSVCGVLAWWTSIQGVTNKFPDYYHFAAVKRVLYVRGVYFKSQSVPPEELVSRIRNDKPQCCRKFDEVYLDWYLTSVSLLLPESAISTELVWRCRCQTSNDDEVFRVFNSYLTWKKWGRYFKEECGESLDRMIDTAEGYGFDPSMLKDRRKVTLNASDINSSIIDQPSSGNNRAEEGVNHSPFRAESLDAAELEGTIQAAEKEPRRRALPVPPTRSLPKSDTKISKSAQAEHVKKYLVNLLQELENSTRQILELVPRGKQKGSSLPWKSLPQILSDRGYEFQNWPRDVPVPGSGSTLCDDNKGIHGLNAKHLRALYDATLSEDRPLRFRKVGEGVSAQARLEQAAMRGIRRGRDEESDNGAMEAGPSKRSRLSATGEGSSRWTLD